jgi:DNA polymerase-3 subunit alpha
VDDLFGEVSAQPASSSDVYANFRHIRPWAAQRRLQEEKETLGLYLSGHPISEFLPELLRITRHRIDALKPEKGAQLVAGLIHDIRLIKSKRGDNIAIVTLDDRSDRIEVSLFGEAYVQYRELLVKDTIVVVEGVVSIDEYNGNGQLQVRTRRVLTLQDARREFVRALELTLHHSRLSVESLRSLGRLLSEYRADAGQQQGIALLAQGGSASAAASEAPLAAKGCEILVHLELPEVKGSVVLGDSWRVLPDDALLQRMRDAFGADNVSLSYGFGP